MKENGIVNQTIDGEKAPFSIAADHQMVEGEIVHPMDLLLMVAVLQTEE